MKVIKVIMAQISKIISKNGLTIVNNDINEYCNINYSPHYELSLLVYNNYNSYLSIWTYIFCQHLLLEYIRVQFVLSNIDLGVKSLTSNLHSSIPDK